MTATCIDCPFFQSYRENSRGWCNAFNVMAREHHQRTNDCEHQLDNAEAETKKAIAKPAAADESIVEYVVNLEEKIERAVATAVNPFVEVDSADGAYRVWNSYHFLGRFYRHGTGWLADPAFGQVTQHRTSAAAQRAVVRAWGG